MERAKPQQVDPSFFERNKLLHNIRYLCGVEDAFYCAMVNHVVKISGIDHISQGWIKRVLHRLKGLKGLNELKKDYFRDV
jgi:hypothetical protein